MDFAMNFEMLKPYIDHCGRKTLKRGEYIYNMGDDPRELYLIDTGLVGLFHIAESGKETFLRVFTKGSIFGHRSYFAETPYHATAMALEKTDLCVISTEQCQDICESNPGLLKEMLKMVAQELGAAELRMAGLHDKSANRRIIESLIYLKYKNPDHIWTRKEVAEFSASTFETVARIMTKLSQEGLIEKVGRDYNILNSEKLVQYSKEIV
jgi:CRP-like cAMP-binding protein